MKGSGIGGQAVMEGVMMKNGDKYAVAVRKPDGEIVAETKEYKSLGSRSGLNKIPIVRGVLAFIDSLKLGIGSLTYSASFFEEEDVKPATEDEKAKKEKQEKVMMAGTVVLSVVLAVGIFMLLPYFISRILKNHIESEGVLALIEGVIRVGLFIGYVAAISLMDDIKRVFRYHGAEHKSINCIENGLELTVENVKKQSRHHKRCGTSFLLIVMLISVLFFMFIRFDNAWLRIAARLILIPIIAGISYEFIRLAGRSNNKIVEILSKPGLALQNLTTAEPDESMIECAIASVEAVFDWKDFLAHYDEQPEGTACPIVCDTDGETAGDEADTGAAETAKAAEQPAKPVGKNKHKKHKSEQETKPEAVPVKEQEQKEEPAPAEQPEPKEEPKPEEQPVQQSEPELEGDDIFVARRKAKEAAGETAEELKEAAEAEKPAKPKTEDKVFKTASGKIDLNTPVPDDEEDDEILKALDQYFILKQKKD
ncbi:MAG: DUF1385 domain-containing protein [Lachnospiraceae bacterium]|nr:DUF1385 domain-containing protein [Lachnospiraceae bacterium]